MTKEELEKEAVDKITQQFGTSGEYNTRIRIWQDGAEFGYNKCKEEINQKVLALQLDMDRTIEQNFALKAQIEKMTDIETMLKILKDRGVIRSWYYNGTYHVGDELPKEGE